MKRVDGGDGGLNRKQTQTLEVDRSIDRLHRTGFELRNDNGRTNNKIVCDKLGIVVLRRF